MALMKLVSDFLALPGLVVPIAVPSRNGYGFPVRDHRTTTLAVRADARDHDPCRDSTGIWTTPFEVGGPAGGIAGNPIGGGTPWCETRFTDGQTHDVITGIHVWFKKKIGINAIQFTYSGTDQQPTFYGHNTQEENDGDGSITLAAGEIITQLSLWNDQGDKPRRLGRILMVTSAGQTPDVGSVRNDAVEQQVRDLGGGLLVGAYGGEGSSIDYIAFLFLKSKIDKTSITDIQYTNLPAAGAADSSIQTVALLDTTVGNSIDNTHDITVAVGVDQQDTKSSTYSQSVTAMFGQAITAEVSFEVLGVGGKITDEFHWEVFTQITHEISSMFTPLLVLPVACVACLRQFTYRAKKAVKPLHYRQRSLRRLRQAKANIAQSVCLPPSLALTDRTCLQYSIYRSSNSYILTHNSDRKRGWQLRLHLQRNARISRRLQHCIRQ